MPAHPYLTPGGPRVLAHRGLALEVPENTLAAFAHALAVGVTHIETDVRASRDGVAVISHDLELNRVAGRTGTVSDEDARALSQLDLGGGHGMPALADALEAFPDARFNIDLKSAAAIAPTVEAVRRQRADHRVLLTSFSERRRAAAVRPLPGVATSASLLRFIPALLAARAGLRPVVRAAMAGLHAVQIPERALGIETTATPILRAFHDAGVEVHVWTVNEPTVMRSHFLRGVDGIITDRADLAVEVLRTL